MLTASVAHVVWVVDCLVHVEGRPTIQIDYKIVSYYVPVRRLRLVGNPRCYHICLVRSSCVHVLPSVASIIV